MKSERERQMPYGITYMWNLKCRTNKLIYRTETKLMDIENRLVVAKGDRVEGGMEWEAGLSRYMLLYLKG